MKFNSSVFSIAYVFKKDLINLLHQLLCYMPNLTKTPFGISCDLSWETMPEVAENCRFCSHCNKVVKDLTRLSKNEFKNELKLEPEICGRYDFNQVAYEVVLPSKLIARFLIPVSIFTTTDIVSGNKPNTEYRIKEGDYKDILVRNSEFNIELSDNSSESRFSNADGRIRIFINRRFPFIHIVRNNQYRTSGVPLR